MDVKSRLPAAEAAIRLAPNGGYENIEERDKTGYLRASRRSSPTARSFQNRLVAAIGMCLKMEIVKSADISRAFPKARAYAESDCKWLEWPRNLTKDPEFAKKIGFVHNTILKILRPLYGTTDAGKDFVSSLTYDFLHIIGLQNSSAAPCLFVSIPKPAPITQYYEGYRRHIIYTSRIFDQTCTLPEKLPDQLILPENSEIIAASERRKRDCAEELLS